MFDVRRLRALREVADRGTIAAAADALAVTPSAVSQQLSALEREVGHPLLEPNGRTVRLTSAAGVLLRHADALFAQIERLDADLAAQAGVPHGEVHVAAFSSGISGVVVPAIRVLKARAPAVRLRVSDMEAAEAFMRLGRREVDVVLAMECLEAPAPDDPRFLRVDLMRDVLDAALPVDHPLAGKERVALADLREDPWVGAPVGWSCDQVVMAGCQAAGFTPRIEHRSADWAAVLAMVGTGLGVGLVPRLAQLVPPPSVAIRPLVGDPPCRHLLAACRRGAEASPAVTVTLQALADVCSAST